MREVPEVTGAAGTNRSDASDEYQRFLKVQNLVCSTSAIDDLADNTTYLSD